jgi:hypothetical protein
METTVRLRLSELNHEVVNRLKEIFLSASSGKDPVISISLSFDEHNQQYTEKLKRGIAQLEKGESMVFTMEELEAYLTK